MLAVAEERCVSSWGMSGERATGADVAHDPPPAAGAGLRRSAGWMLISAALWVMLNEAEPESWLVGAPAVLLAGALSAKLPARPAGAEGRFSFAGLTKFLPFFIFHSILGGWDVALRALRPRMAVEPGFFAYDLRLRPGPARDLFLDALTLLPGTLTAELEGDCVQVHALNLKALSKSELMSLEARAGRVFGSHLRPA